MINIVSDKDRIIRSIKELEFEFSQGNVSRRAYHAQRKGLESQLETLDTADRIRRMQGKGQAEKPLDYWTEQEKEKKAQAEREELLKQYVTSPPPKKNKLSGTRGKTLLAVFLVVAFFVGTGFGVLLMGMPGKTVNAALSINESAFPAKNITNNTTNVTKTTVTKKTNTTVTPKPTPTPTPTPTPPVNGT